MTQFSNPTIQQSAAAPQAQAAQISRETLLNYLIQASQTMRRVELGVGIVGWLCMIVTVLLVAVLIDHWLWTFNVPARLAVFGFLVGWSVWWVPRRIVPLLFKPIHPEHTARKIELQFPQLKESLISWLQLSSENAAPKGVLAVVGRFAVRNLGGHDSSSIIDAANLIRLAALLFSFVMTGTIYFFVSPKSGTTSLSRMLMPWANIAPAARVQIVDVSPGDATITQGSHLPLAVTVRGMHQGDSVRVRYDLSDGQLVGQKLSMKKEIEGINYRLDFGNSFGGIHQPLQYWIEAGDATAGPFAVKVQVVPIVAIDRMEYEYPTYTKLKATTIKNDGTIEAPEGTRVRLFAHSNQPMSKSRIEFDPIVNKGVTQGASSLLDLETQDTKLRGSWLLKLNDEKSNPTRSTYRIKAFNSLGEPNHEPVIYKIKVIGDYPPEVRLQSDLPAQIQVPVNGAQEIEMRAVDPDYGLTSLRATLSQNKKSIVDQPLFESKEGVTTQIVRSYTIRPSELGLKVGDQLEFRAIATDNRNQVGTEIPEPNEATSTPLSIQVVEARPASESDKEKSANNGSKNKNEPPSTSKTQKGNSDSLSKQKDGQQPNSQPKESNGDTSNPNNKQEPGTDKPKNEDRAASGKQNGNKQQEQGGKKKSQPDGTGAGNESGEGSTDESSSDGQSSKSQGSNANKSQSKSSRGGEQNGQEGSDSQQDSNTDNSASKSGGSSARSNKNASSQSGDPGSSEQELADDSSDPSEPRHDGKTFEQIDQIRREKENQQTQKAADGSAPKDAKSSEGTDGNNNQGNKQSATQGTKPQNDGKNNDAPSNVKPTKDDGSQNQSGKQSADPSQKNSNSTKEPSGSKTSDDKSSADNSPADKSSGEKSSNEKSSGDKSSGEKSSGDKSSGEKSSGDKSSGDKPSGDKSSGDKSSGDKSSGDKSSNEKSSGDKSSGDNSSGDKSSGDKSSGDKSSGDKSSGDKSSGDKSSGDKSSGDKSSGDKSSGDKSSGDKPSGDKSSGDKSSGDKSSGDKSSGEKSSGEKSSGEKSSGEKSSGDKSSGDKSSGDKSSSDKSSGDKSSGDKSSGDKTNSGKSESANSKSGDGGTQGGDSAQASSKGKKSDSQKSGNGSPSQDQSGGSGMGGSQSGASANQSASKPEPANQDYANQVTDLALDYLKQQRDQPDPDLLRKMNWTADDMKKFIDRWTQAKELAKTDPNKKRELDASLRSLGLRPGRGQERKVIDRDDELKGLLEEGTRVRPPASIREQFEQFRKAASKP